MKYAIRSIYRYFTGLTGVLLIGDKPTWYTGDHIPLADLKGEKERSMQLKVMAAPDEVFLYSNDDYYAAQPFDETLPNYFDGTCGTMAEISTFPTYKTMYENCPPHWLNFDVHTPMIMRSARFKERYEAMGEAQTPIKTTYAQGLKGAYLADVKIRGPHEIDELEYKTKDRPFFSTHDSAIDDNLEAFLHKKYPRASPYEKPGY